MLVFNSVDMLHCVREVLMQGYGPESVRIDSICYEIRIKVL